ncbi:MAG: aspartate kinase [Candidatus Protochlamydia sp.]|nr:aspartate kinase [Candidatus Protochlamydia sp.]
MKFGGASVASASSFTNLADLIIGRHHSYPYLVVVVSAMGQTTDQLIELAKQVHPNPPQREYDMLISAGERISMSLLAMSLCLKGKEAISFTGSQSGILTCGRHTDAQIIDVKPYRLIHALKQNKIVIVAGFQGVSPEKEITTLGRGGSDTSAVALGAALGAEKIEFFKDVPGIFEQDPKINAKAVRYASMTYEEAYAIASRGARILHPRAILLAAKNGLPLYVQSFIPSDHHSSGTYVEDKKIRKPPIPIFEI